jgi:2-polyprenyl-6-methoxyphenol hydroxylase-like FAD-dependent oxidoreductase
VTSDSTHALVVGGSIAGLATALALSRRGIEVRLVESDETAAPGLFDRGNGQGRRAGNDPLTEDARRSPRRATPQASHSHAFLARCRELLRVEAPEVLDTLREAGALELSLAERRPATVPHHARHPADDDLVVVAARRTTFEAALRLAVARRPEIEVVLGRKVDGLVVEPGPVATVRGVTFDDGGHLDAGVTIDATGRKSLMTGWLEAEKVPVIDDSSECGIVYLSRFYRRAPGAQELALPRGYCAGGSLDRYSCLVFPGDDGSFSVTFGILPEDRTLRGLRDAPAFDAAVRAIPSLAPWLDEATEPISDVRMMAGLTNSIRRTTEAGAPGVLGWTAVGDAAATSNPAHSRGCTLAILHATGVADAIAEHAPTRGATDAAALAEACAAVVERDQLPWIDDSIEQDRHRLARWRAVDGHWHSPHAPSRVCNGETYGAAQHDAYVWRRFSRLQQLLDQPEEVLGDPRVVARVRAVQASGVVTEALEGPNRGELIELLAGVTEGWRTRWVTA